MGEKSENKKQYILGKAKEVFTEKGYKNVTMKDIVDQSDISRGGLYLYFESTKQILEEVLQMEASEDDDVFTDSITEETTAADILALFLKEQKKEIMGKKKNLTIAIYEYYFEYKISKKDNMLRKQFDVAVKMINKLIEDGVESGEFYCENTMGMARNIMYVLEGLKISAQTMGISEGTIDQALLFMIESLGVE